MNGASHRGQVRGRALVAYCVCSVLAFVPATACSSSDTSPGTEPICNTLVDDGPTVVPTAAPGTAPGATGGTILPGTYELSTVTLYVGADVAAAPPAGTLSQVFEITDGKIEQVGKVNDVENHATTSFSVSGTTLSTTDTCPAPRSEDLEFTATDTDFRVYVVGSRGTLEQVYALRAK